MTLVRRCLLTLVVGGGLVLIALLAIGGPRWGAAWSLLSGGYPTSDRVLALLEIVVWLVVAGVVIGLLVWSLRAVSIPQLGTRRRALEAVAILLAGCIIFLGGVSRHASLSAGPTGGSVTEATHLAP
jgi:hypothetical protein